MGMKLKDSKKWLEALADETRLRILNLLGEGELCVCDLMRVLKEPQSKVSRHLAYLRRAKLVEARQSGMWMYYRLAKPGTAMFRNVLTALKHGRGEFEELKKDIQVFKKNRNCLVACC